MQAYSAAGEKWIKATQLQQHRPDDNNCCLNLPTPVLQNQLTTNDVCASSIIDASIVLLMLLCVLACFCVCCRACSKQHTANLELDTQLSPATCGLLLNSACCSAARQ
jgi:hypothetical protein